MYLINRTAGDTSEFVVVRSRSDKESEKRNVPYSQLYLGTFKLCLLAYFVHQNKVLSSSLIGLTTDFKFRWT